MKSKTLWIAYLALLTAAPALAQAPADRWSFSLTPYLWLPSMDGTLRYGPPPATGSSPNVTVDADTLLGALDFAIMLGADARKGRWSIATDLIYLDLGSDGGRVKSVDFNPGSGPVNVDTSTFSLNADTDVKGTVWSVYGGYSVVYERNHTMDVIAGFRYFDLDATTNWTLSAAVTGPAGTQNFARAGSVSKGDELWDVVVGVRGRLNIGSGNWFVPYHLDFGGGDSKLTWQGIVGVGYSYKWGDLFLAYRYLSYEAGGNKLVEDLKFGGLGAGLTFRF